MAKSREEGDVALVDLSPEALQVKENLSSVGRFILDVGRVQEIVESYRKKKGHLTGVTDNRGLPVPIGNMPVTQGWLETLEQDMIAMVEDCCEDSEGLMAKKAERQKLLNREGGIGIESSIDTALAPPRGPVITKVSVTR